jgi:DNA-binding CsgD family transcriptional regulator
VNPRASLWVRAGSWPFWREPVPSRRSDLRRICGRKAEVVGHPGQGLPDERVGIVGAQALWERATPLRASRPAVPGDRLTSAQQAVLESMAEGLHDDAIARRAGISTTTVRRHITAIMGRLGVSSRFAAGAAAQRRGWIE